MKKGRHRRYEEARAMKRGPDLDIEAIFEDLESVRPASVLDDDPEAPLPEDDPDLLAPDEEDLPADELVEELNDDEERDRR